MEREIPLSERKGRAASNKTAQHPVEYCWTLRDTMDRNWRVLHGKRTQSVVLWTLEEETARSWFHCGQEDCKQCAGVHYSLRENNSNKSGKQTIQYYANPSLRTNLLLPRPGCRGVLRQTRDDYQQYPKEEYPNCDG